LIADGRVCVKEFPGFYVSKVYVENLDLIWHDRIDTNPDDNGSFQSWILEQWGNAGDFNGWHFNIEIPWAIEDRWLLP